RLSKDLRKICPFKELSLSLRAPFRPGRGLSRCSTPDRGGRAASAPPPESESGASRSARDPHDEAPSPARPAGPNQGRPGMGATPRLPRDELLVWTQEATEQQAHQTPRFTHPPPDPLPWAARRKARKSAEALSYTATNGRAGGKLPAGKL